MISAWRLSLIAVECLILMACSYSSDKGDASKFPFAMRAMEGRISYAFVYVDENNNGRFEAWEDNALTDQDGYVTRNESVIPPVQYCDLDPSNLHYKHCLLVKGSNTSVNLRVVGGFNTWSGLPFSGELGYNAPISAGSSTNMLSLSPPNTFVDNIIASTLLNNTGDPDNFVTAFLNREKLTQGDVILNDYLKFTQKPTNQFGSVDELTSIRIGAVMHKLVDVIGKGLERTYLNDGKLHEDVAQGFSSIVYFSMVETYLSDKQKRPLLDLVSDTSALSNIINRSRNFINLSFPSLVRDDSLVSEGIILERAVATVRAVKNIYSIGLGSTTDTETLKARSFLVDLFTSIASDFSLPTEARYQNWNEKVLNPFSAILTSNAIYFQSYVQAKRDAEGLYRRLVKEGFDFSDLIKSFPDREPLTAGPFFDRLTGESGLAGATLTLHRSIESEDQTAIISFIEENARGGSVTVTMISSEGSTRIMNGKWDRIDDFSVLFLLRHSGGVFEPLILSTGQDGSAFDNKFVYFFRDNNNNTPWEPVNLSNRGFSISNQTQPN